MYSEHKSEKEQVTANPSMLDNGDGTLAKRVATEQEVIELKGLLASASKIDELPPISQDVLFTPVQERDLNYVKNIFIEHYSSLLKKIHIACQEYKSSFSHSKE